MNHDHLFRAETVALQVASIASIEQRYGLSQEAAILGVTLNV